MTAPSGEAVTVHQVAPDIRARIVRDLPVLDPALDSRVETHWLAAQQRTGGRLFNGRVFSVDHLTSSGLTGHLTEFRRIVAQMADPGLHKQLRVRPLAVCGVVRCAGGIVLGRREARAVYQPGRWQLPPAGSVDARAPQADGTIDLRRHLLTELEEELGLTNADVTAMRPLCIVEHDGSHVLDLGFALDTPLAGSDVLRAHAAAGDRAEYDQLTVVPCHRLEGRVAELGASLVPTARIHLRQLGLLA